MANLVKKVQFLIYLELQCAGSNGRRKPCYKNKSSGWLQILWHLSHSMFQSTCREDQDIVVLGDFGG